MICFFIRSSRNNAVISVGEKVYIGKNPELRVKILSVKRRISYRELTNAAENELPFILESIINERELEFSMTISVSLLLGTRSIIFTMTFSFRPSMADRSL